VKLRSRCNPCGTKAQPEADPALAEKQLCLEDAGGACCYEISSEKVKHRAERREYDETFALVPSLGVLLLWGRTSIDTV